MSDKLTLRPDEQAAWDRFAEKIGAAVAASPVPLNMIPSVGQMTAVAAAMADALILERRKRQEGAHEPKPSHVLPLAGAVVIVRMGARIDGARCEVVNHRVRDGRAIVRVRLLAPAGTLPVDELLDLSPGDYEPEPK